MAEAKSIEQEMTEAFTSGGGDEGSVAVVPDGGGADPAAGGEGGKPSEPAKSEAAGEGDGTRDKLGRFVKQDKAAGEPEKAAGEAAPKAGEGEAAKAGGEVAAQAAQAAGEQRGEKQEQAASTGEAEAPPSTWRPQAKDVWASLPAIAREEFKKRESDIQKFVEQYKPAAEFGRSVYEVIKPFEENLRASGVKPQDAMKNVFEIDDRLRRGSQQEKLGTLLWFGNQYGIDLATALGATPEQSDDLNAAVTRAIAPVMQQFEGIRQSQEQAKKQQQEQQKQQFNQAINVFRNATDEKGQLKHVHFDKVWERYMWPYLQSRTATTFDEAYAMACRAHPEVSAALSAEQRKAEEARRLEDQRKKAEDAKRAAAANATGQGGVGMADTRKLSVEDEIAAHMKGQRI